MTFFPPLVRWSYMRDIIDTANRARVSFLRCDFIYSSGQLHICHSLTNKSVSILTPITNSPLQRLKISAYFWRKNTASWRINYSTFSEKIKINSTYLHQFHCSKKTSYLITSYLLDSFGVHSCQLIYRVIYCFICITVITSINPGTMSEYFIAMNNIVWLPNHGGIYKGWRVYNIRLVCSSHPS